MTHHHGITHTRHTFDLWNKVDVCIVLKEFDVVLVFGIKNREYHQHRSLALADSYTGFGYFGRQKRFCHRNTVLYVDLCHVRVSPLFEIDRDIARATVGGSRAHVHHVFYSVYLVFQRCDNGIKHSLCICTLIRGTY